MASIEIGIESLKVLIAKASDGKIQVFDIVDEMEDHNSCVKKHAIDEKYKQRGFLLCQHTRNQKDKLKWKRRAQGKFQPEHMQKLEVLCGAGDRNIALRNGEMVGRKSVGLLKGTKGRPSSSNWIQALRKALRLLAERDTGRRRQCLGETSNGAMVLTY